MLLLKYHDYFHQKKENGSVFPEVNMEKVTEEKKQELKDLDPKAIEDIISSSFNELFHRYHLNRETQAKSREDQKKNTRFDILQFISLYSLPEEKQLFWILGLEKKYGKEMINVFIHHYCQRPSFARHLIRYGNLESFVNAVKTNPEYLSAVLIDVPDLKPRLLEKYQEMVQKLEQNANEIFAEYVKTFNRNYLENYKRHLEIERIDLKEAFILAYINEKDDLVFKNLLQWYLGNKRPKDTDQFYDQIIRKVATLKDKKIMIKIMANLDNNPKGTLLVWNGKDRGCFY